MRKIPKKGNHRARGAGSKMKAKGKSVHVIGHKRAKPFRAKKTVHVDPYNRHKPRRKR